MIGIYYALGAMLFFGLGDLVYKRGAAAGAEPHQFLMVQSWVFTPVVILYAALTGTLHFVPGSLWGALAGVFIFAGFYNFAYSLKTGSISLNAPLFRLSFVITAALAVMVLGEPFTLPKLSGLVLALVATWLLLGGRTGHGASTTREARASLVRVLVATACVGVGNFLYALGLRAGATPGSIVIAQAAMVVTLATVFTAIVDGRIKPSGAALRYPPRAALVLAVAFVLMAEAMALAETSVVVPIAQMGFVVSALAGFLFLREPFTARKGAGIVAAFAALASLALR